MNEEQIRAEFEVWYKGKYWSRLSDRAVSIAFRTKSNGEYDSYRIRDAWEIWRAALASQAKEMERILLENKELHIDLAKMKADETLASQAERVLPKQEPLGSEFEKVLHENLDSLYETGAAPQPTDERVRELERQINLLKEQNRDLTEGLDQWRHLALNPKAMETLNLVAKSISEANQ